MMSLDAFDNTIDSAINHLLPEVEAFLATYTALQAENQSLRDQLNVMTQEHASLVEKTTQAHARVENMISRLKILEQ